MTVSTRPEYQENLLLSELVAESRLSHKRLAFRVNELCRAQGLSSEYTHTSVANWCRRGMTPKWPVPKLVCVALTEALCRPIGVRDIGVEEPSGNEADVGLSFPRRQDEALAEVILYWSTLNRRHFLSTAFASAAFTEPTTRWLISPTEPFDGSRGHLTVGRSEILELRSAADEARVWDSRYGGAAWKSKSLTAFLFERVSPLLQGDFREPVARDLFSVTSEIARLAGWTAFDAGQHRAAQGHYIQALRLAKAGGDVNLGSYVLTTMAMQSLLLGFPSQAVDMAQGAFERDRSVHPHVQGFAKLIEARAHAKSGDARAASACFATAEQLQARGADGEGPAWIDFFTRSRIITDAAEIYRDLGNPRAVFAWHRQGGLPGQAFARSRAIRLSVLATASAQAGSLDQSLHFGRESLALFSRLQSIRGMDYLRILTDALGRWGSEQAVVSYVSDVNRTASTLRPRRV